MKLQSLSDIFERRLLRIPDYQRGYAWSSHQLEDFWEDLIQLNPNKVHYTGVITLEPVPQRIWSKWEQDEWIIEGVGYRSYYVVDGQQRLTTSMILIQAITESVDNETQLNYQSIANVRQRYVLSKADDGLRRSFIFGYEKDNPSDEYLKTQIFSEASCTNTYQETLYTRNLLNAKRYFKKQLVNLTNDEIAALFKKLTQKLKYNLYEIDEEIDVFVTFETMNNRGKPLTSLELLKNRLIYLSTLFDGHQGHDVLRQKINCAWKTIYEYLGKNPDSPLSDEVFLKNHWVMYFKYTRMKGDDYINYLLNDRFTARNVTHPKAESQRLTLEDINDYVTNLQESIRYWFYMHNPYYPMPIFENEQNKLWIDKVQRLSFRAFRPLILAAFVSKNSTEQINQLLQAMERYNFILFTLCQRRNNTGDSEFYRVSRSLLFRETSIPEIINTINEWIAYYYDPERFYNFIDEKFTLENDGFFRWEGLRYFLYEYEAWLQQVGKQSSSKLEWASIVAKGKDNVSIEHIYPQTAKKDYWLQRYKHLSKQQKYRLTHSLGNLLPLSISKNASLQNDGFDIKKNNGSGVGYYNGSAAENEVAQYEEWLPSDIKKRGVDLLNFMEKRWKIILGDNDFKLKLLHLSDIETIPKDHPFIEAKSA